MHRPTSSHFSSHRILVINNVRRLMAEHESGTPRHAPPGGPAAAAWRPLAPDDLLLRAPAAETPAAEPPKPAVSLERRQELERIVRDAPAGIDAYLELAEIYRGDGRLYEAQRVLERGTAVVPDHPRLLWQLEEVVLGRVLRRLREAKERLEASPSDAARLELQRCQTEWACRRADVCRRRLARDPDNRRLSLVLGEALRDNGRFEEALQAVEPALASDSEAPAAHLIRGQCLVQMRRELEALAALRAAALRRATPAPRRIRVTALRIAATVSARLGLWATAERYLRGILQTEPDDTEAIDALARLTPLWTDDPTDANQESLLDASSDR